MHMKNTLLISALVAILGLAFAGAPVSAQSTNAAAATAPKKSKEAKTPYKGSITAITATSVTVANKTQTLTLAIAATTKFEKDKKPATAADFAVGDTITGSYTKDATGAMTAASIHKKTDKAAATKTSTGMTTGTAPAAAPAPATN